MTRPVYVEMLAVEQTPTVSYTADSRAAILDLLVSASDHADFITRRRYHPEVGATLTTSYPNQTYFDGPEWFTDRDWLTIDSVTIGGVTVPPSDYVSSPIDDGPPWDTITLRDTSTHSWGDGDSEPDSIVITGTSGVTSDTRTAGELGGTITGTDTTLIGSDPTAIDVGSLIAIDDEWLTIIDRDWLDSGDTITADLDTSSRQLETAATLLVGERIRVGFEEMMVTAISGTTVMVDRAVGGTTPAAHLNGTGIDRWNSYTASRGAAGSTAAAHTIAAPITKWVPPALLAEYVLANVLTALGQHASGYNRTVGSGDQQREASGKGLAATRSEFIRRFRRRRILRIL